MPHHENENMFTNPSHKEEEFEMMNPMNMGHHIHHHTDHNELVETIQHCEATCEHMITHLLQRPDINSRIRQTQFLRDCADVCTLTVKYIARKSPFAKHMTNLCAYICEMCGRECSRFSDEMSQNCARVCLNCARECKGFTGMRY